MPGPFSLAAHAVLLLIPAACRQPRVKGLSPPDGVSVSEIHAAQEDFVVTSYSAPTARRQV
jgi:hypothetical protein